MQPEGGTKYVGESHTFSIEVSGRVGAIHYQWTKDGYVLPDSDSAIYEIVSLTQADEGAYACEAWDEAKTLVTSDSAYLTVLLRVPVAGMVGLGLLLGACGLGGLAALRKRR